MATVAISRSPDTASGCDCNDRPIPFGMRYIRGATVGILREAVPSCPRKRMGGKLMRQEILHAPRKRGIQYPRSE